MDKINNLLELVEGKIKQNILQISSLKSLNDNLNYENIRLSKENVSNQKLIKILPSNYQPVRRDFFGPEGTEGTYHVTSARDNSF